MKNLANCYAGESYWLIEYTVCLVDNKDYNGVSHCVSDTIDIKCSQSECSHAGKAHINIMATVCTIILRM